MIKKHNLTVFYLAFAVYTIAAGLVHPVTPAYLQSINASSAMFGITYACMALGQFLFSPFWGKMGDTIGYLKCIAIGCVLYGCSGLFFSMSTCNIQIICARSLAGFGVCAILVNAMAYIISLDASEQDKSQLLVIYASFQSVGVAFGYLFGGVVGDFDLHYSFYLQFILLVCIAPVFLLKLKETSKATLKLSDLTFNEVNPFKAIITASKSLNKVLIVFLFSVFLSMMGSTGFDQNFSYFQRVVMGFAPSSTGILKAVIGFIALFLNLTFNMWLIKNTNISKSMSYLLFFGGLGILGMVYSTSTTFMIIFALFYYACNAVYIPLQQMVMTKNAVNISKGQIAGLFNTFKAFGQVLGALYAGFIFDYNPYFAFVTFAICLVLACVFGLINYKQLNKKGVYND